MRRASLFLFHSCCLLLTISALSACSESKSSARLAGDPPRRVIWIAIDSLRADHMGAWGYDRDTSPWMDGLAQKSVTFSWAVSPANATLRSVASYFSGKPFSQLGDLSANHLPEPAVTLAESLSAAGVTCTAFSANIAISPARGYAQGFDQYRIVATPSKALSDIGEIIADVREHYRPTGGREFVYIHTMDVHSPYRPSHPYGSMFTRPYARDVVHEGNAWIDDKSFLANSLFPYWSEHHRVTQEDIDFLVGLYDGAIRYTDAKLPALLDALGWDPARDLLILTADHGEALYEHGWWGHFATLAPSEIHVPLIVNYARIEERRVETPVSLMDVYATVLDLFGLPAPDATKGLSLVSALSGGPVPPHAVYSETAQKHGATAAIVADDYWYYLEGNRTWLKPWQPWPYEENLYRYLEDPLGRENVIAAHPEAADDLNARLRAFNPRFERYSREVMRGDDSDVAFGENVLKPAAHQVPVHRSVDYSEGEWSIEAPITAIVYTAEDLTPFEPLYLQMPYTLETGAFAIRAWPADYRPWPGNARRGSAWTYHCQKPGEYPLFATTIVPTSDTITFMVEAEPGTRARIGTPTLRPMLIDRVEPWPRPEHNPAGYDAVPEEIERMKALGYF